MGVHVGEIHTDVAPAASAAGSASQARLPEPLGAAQERWGEFCRTAEDLVRRTACEGFDD
ncbi:hypothetical protein [Pseudarthrobacter sulfonivorans]|uniref:hypothetical protein n=1 Tax=Pseudarthrobacter sulfonivorans TaxID=121292 RepID=UPI002106F8D3|nr:hypothetical protein [Pseudarthrobacter sulfonivorans]